MWSLALALFFAPAVLLGASSGAATTLRTYDASQEVASKVVLHWSIRNATLQLALEAPGAVGSWAAIGFASSEKNAMISYGAGSDITMGYVKSEECALGCINSYSARSYPPEGGTPTLDATRSVTLVHAQVVGGQLLLEFDRLLDTGVAGDIPINPSVPQRVIWAFNPSPAAVTSDVQFEKHLPDTRGVASVLFSSVGVVPVTPRSILSFPV